MRSATGSGRYGSPSRAPRDEGLLELLLGSLDPDLQLAFDTPHGSWDGIEGRLAARGAVRVNDLESEAPVRYLRFREPPYDEAALAALAASVRGELMAGISVYAYFRHEEEPTAPRYASRLLELVTG